MSWLWHCLDAFGSWATTPHRTLKSATGPSSPFIYCGIFLFERQQ